MDDQVFLLCGTKLTSENLPPHSQGPGVSPAWHHTEYLSTEGAGSQHGPAPTFRNASLVAATSAMLGRGLSHLPAPWSLILHFQFNAPSALPGCYFLLRGWVTLGLGAGIHTVGCVDYVLKTTDTKFSVFSIHLQCLTPSENPGIHLNSRLLVFQHCLQLLPYFRG